MATQEIRDTEHPGSVFRKACGQSWLSHDPKQGLGIRTPRWKDTDHCPTGQPPLHGQRLASSSAGSAGRLP